MTKNNYFFIIFIIISFFVVGCSDPTGKSQFEKGLLKLQEGKYSSAMKLLEEAVKKQPSSADRWYHLGVAYYNMEKFNQAAVAFEKAADLAPEDSCPLEFAAIVYCRLKRYNDARTAIEQARERDPKAARILTRAALIELNAGENQKAFKLMRKAVKDFPDYPPALYNLAVFYKDYLADNASAKVYFGKFLEIDSSSPKAELARKALLESKEEKKEEPDVQKVTPKTTPPQPLLKKEPTQHVEKAAIIPPATVQEPKEIKPEQEDPSQKILADAKLRIKKGSFDEALILLKQAIQLNPQSADAMWELAYLYDKHLNMEESANLYYVRFIEKFPSDPRISQIPQKAIQQSKAQQPVKVPPPPKEIVQNINNAEANQLFQEAVKCHEKKEWDKAIKLYDKAFQLNPRNINAIYNKGLIYKEKNDNENAKKSFYQVLEINPNMYKARYNLALIYKEESNYEQAVEELNSALRIKPDDANIHYVLGIIYWKLMKYDIAVTHFKRYLQIAPNGKYAQVAKSYIEKHQ